ncbi:SCP domain-containing protein [Abeliophyllum distichum]|uniref:SCP domain-containing protein n=1 Tax=Abeliophyllum distichum TaxID=126358 RepID=A0ABD1U2D4_9LAMI
MGSCSATIQDYLAVHNEARARVHVAPMLWDENLATYALNYANKIKVRSLFRHSNGPYGENLAMGTTMTDRQGRKFVGRREERLQLHGKFGLWNLRALHTSGVTRISPALGVHK